MNTARAEEEAVQSAACTAAVRDYRRQITTAGQSSPPLLGQCVARILTHNFADSMQIDRPLSVVDIGCGLGRQMTLIRELLPTLFSTVAGADWSPATVQYHKENVSPYQQVTLCDSSRLPYGDKQFDLALSMENLEHLYNRDSLAAIRELARIARYVLITTPLPHDCINFKWIYPEVIEAILDPVPLTEHDFTCLESCVHKSTLFEKSMTAAGFTYYAAGHGYYFAPAAAIQADRICSVGIADFTAAERDRERHTSRQDDYKELYLQLLAKSAELDKQIKAHPLYTPPTP